MKKLTMKHGFEIRDLCVKWGMTEEEREAMAIIDELTERNRLEKTELITKIKEVRKSGINKEIFTKKIFSKLNIPIKVSLVILPPLKESTERRIDIFWKILQDEKYLDNIYNRYITEVLPWLKQ